MIFIIIKKKKHEKGQNPFDSNNINIDYVGL